MTDDQFRANVRKELDQGWTGLKIAAGCPGAIAEARETAEYVRRHLHPVAAKSSLRGSSARCGPLGEEDDLADLESPEALRASAVEAERLLAREGP